MSRGRGSNVEETRRRLIEAAINLLARDGAQGASLRAICKEAGQRNTAAVQYHFGSREGLFTAALDHVLLAIDQPIDVTPALSRELGLQPNPSKLQAFVYRAFLPIVLLERRHPTWGAAGQGLLARVILGEMEALTAHMEAMVQAEHAAQVAQLVSLCPGVPAAVMDTRLEIANTAVIIYGIEAAGPKVGLLLDFAAAGLAAPASA